MITAQPLIQEVIQFWYCDKIKKQWFASTPELDQEILDKYGDIWEQASLSKLDNWTETAEGCLALVIILDQFPLNMFRNKAKSFSTEQKAIEIALIAIDKQFDYTIGKDKLSFLFMPLMHSENIENQNKSVNLYTQHQLESNIRFAEHHREIIRKFNRFPHRNKILDRKSSNEETAYLNSTQAFTG